MYEYKFLEVTAKTGITFYFEGFEEIIKEQALEGWRFVTSIPSQSKGMGWISSLSLVFEKTVSTSK